MKVAKRRGTLVPQLKDVFDLSSKRIDFTEKVIAAMELLTQLRFGTAYDHLYNRPLKHVSAYDIPEMKSFPQPLVIDNYGRMKGTVECQHPKFYLRNFNLDCVSWFKETSWDPRESDPTKYDWFSDEYVILWSNRKEWNRAPEKGVVWVGMSRLDGGGIRINSFGIDFWIRKTLPTEHHGHEKILLSRP